MIRRNIRALYSLTSNHKQQIENAMKQLYAFSTLLKVLLGKRLDKKKRDTQNINKD